MFIYKQDIINIPGMFVIFCWFVCAIAICFGYCGKGIKNFSTMSYIGMLSCCHGSACCQRMLFSLHTHYLRYMCVTNFEKRIVLSRIESLLSTIALTDDNDNTAELFVSTLVHYYMQEVAKQARDETESRVLKKLEIVLLSVCSTVKVAKNLQHLCSIRLMNTRFSAVP